MKPGLIIVVVDPDDDYLGIEISAASTRYSGSTRVYAAVDDLSHLASAIAGFPTSAADERRYEFGSTEPGVAGGFARLRFHCVDGAGHAAVEVTIEDDDMIHEAASARFAFPIESSELDRFVKILLHVEEQQRGEVQLRASD